MGGRRPLRPAVRAGDAAARLVGTAAPQATVLALGAAELVGAALEALAADTELFAAERARIRLLRSTTPSI